MSHEFGTPKNTQYSADFEAEKDSLRLMIYEQSECERIRVRIVSRTRELLKDGEVVSQEPVGPTQIAEGSDGVVPCAQRYARDVRVSLRVGSATHLLGRTNAFGELSVNLAAELKQSLFGEGAPPSALLLVEQQEVSPIPLQELSKYESRVSQLVADFEGLLAADGELNSEQIARSYVLYEQLRQLDRGDARISGLHARFLEKLYGRKQEDEAKNLRRNLKALQEAKDVLALGGTGVPMFVQIATNGGEATPAALRWARGEVLMTLRATPSLCQGPFDWTSYTTQKVGPSGRFAFSFLRFAYDDPFRDEVNTLCSRMSRS
ncbi:MAG: hypothetical protein RJA70_584 [Pseudomonadota bacterium]|jgi:hypothetical protein